MVVCRASTQVGLQASVEEMWPAFKNAVSLLAQHCPFFIQSCQLLHGDGGPGTIRLVKFGPASGLVTYAKEEILAVDEENMTLTYLLLEGDLRKQFKLFKPSISLQRADAGGAISEAGDGTIQPPKAPAAGIGIGDADASIGIANGDAQPIISNAPMDQPSPTLSEQGFPSKPSHGPAHRSIAVWTVEYEVEDGMPPPQIELLNEGAKMFFQLLEASVLKTLQDPGAIVTASNLSHAPIMEETPTPLVA